MGHVEIYVSPTFEWDLIVDDLVMASGQADNETAAIDAATLADNERVRRENS